MSKRIHVSYAYDGFATGALLVWFPYWYPLFKKDAPMFYFFPLYFVLLTAGVTLLFLRRDDWVDQESLKSMLHFSNKLRFHPGIIASTVLISLEIHNHFLIFPITMTLFIMRYTFTCYLLPGEILVDTFLETASYTATPTCKASNQSRKRLTSSPLNIRPCWGAKISISRSRTRSIQARLAWFDGIQR